jgi:hypothetical protein
MAILTRCSLNGVDNETSTNGKDGLGDESYQP